MRGRHWFLLIAWLASGVTAAIHAQDGVPTTHWPRHDFFFPFDTAKLASLKERPREVALYYSYNRGPFRQTAKYEVDRLPRAKDGATGFDFKAERDGEFDFVLQLIYSDGRVSPRLDEMSADRRVVIDTFPPAVKINAAENGVEWSSDDDNLDPRGITLECKYPNGAKWYSVPPVRSESFAAMDRYAWKLQPGQQLEVRVKARDRAGNEGVSRLVRVPAPGGVMTSGSGIPTDPLTRNNDWPPRSPGGSDPLAANQPQTQIYYVNNLKFNVDTSINRMGRSGVKAAHLFVSEDQRTWKKASGSPFNILKKPEDEDRTISLPYEVTKEGLYGFIMIPESGAGKKAPDPAPDSPAMVLVEVDTTPPAAKIRSVEVLPGDSRGPRVEISWEAADRNLMARPINLEYALDKKAVQWQPIALQQENNLTKESGRFSWVVPDEKLWRFYVRIRAVDKAANTSEHVYDQEVLVDLERPEAAIKAVQTTPGSGSSLPKSSTRPVTPPKRPSSEGPALPDLP